MVTAAPDPTVSVVVPIRVVAGNNKLVVTLVNPAPRSWVTIPPIGNAVKLCGVSPSLVKFSKFDRI